MRHLAGDVLFVRQLASLAHTLRKRVAALGKEQERIVKEEAEQRDIDSLYRLPLMRTTAPDPEQAGRARRSTD